TDTGKRLADQLSPWARVLKDHLASFPLSQRLEVMQFLMQLIESLQRAGIISLSRMCFTCRFFQPDTYPDPAAPHHCRLMEKPLALSELRFDCPDHEDTLAGKEA
ncbi:MAG: MarR family transcriptional regulator, partial [Nitrospinota bacterium]